MAGFLKFSSLVLRWDFQFFLFSWDRPKPKQIRLPFSRKFLSKFIRHISLIKKSIVATGVNLVTEVEKLNMAMKFVAPVIAFALLVMLPQLANLLERRVCFIGGKTRVRLCLQKKIVALYAQMAREAEHAYSFFHCVMAKCLY